MFNKLIMWWHWTNAYNLFFRYILFYAGKIKDKLEYSKQTVDAIVQSRSR